jgi:hypothetical protein
MARHPGGRTCEVTMFLLPYYALKALALLLVGRHPSQKSSK